MRPGDLVWAGLMAAGVMCLAGGSSAHGAPPEPLRLGEAGYFEARGLNVLVFDSGYDGLFSDAKTSGVGLIHHEVRTATNGDVRLSRTPAQWDPAPEIVKREAGADGRSVEVHLAYRNHGFDYTIRVEAQGDGVLLTVRLPRALPESLEGRAGMNLEFLPSAYFGKAWLADGRVGLFPLHPIGPMEKTALGDLEPAPMAVGKTLVLAPDDPERRVTITSRQGDMILVDGRNQAQNGWFVVRTELPADRSGVVVEWFLSASTIPGWTRPPVIAHSQVGYHPAQEKAAVLELDRRDTLLPTARVLRIHPDGTEVVAFEGPVRRWGQYLRHLYATFDFAAVKDEGLYVIEYGDERTTPFPVAKDVYHRAWWPTLGVFFPVQMDHVLVNEAYRVWHGVSHLDDARQAPPGHVHFDLYAQGPATDTPFAAGEHIPGLDVGGWFDAGDFDIRTQTQYGVVRTLVEVWERFRLDRDQTTVDQARRFVDIHVPDGKPDLLQQIAHGISALLAQHRAVGHAIPGIVEPDLGQYTHLGDAESKTDNKIFDPILAPGATAGDRSGVPDDRWAFTTRTTALNYGSAAALAAASRALRGFDDAMAEESLRTAVRVWDEEHSREPALFRHGNTTGGPIEDEELRTAVELLLTTGEARYRQRVEALWPTIEKGFGRHASLVVRALPRMDDAFRKKVEEAARTHARYLEETLSENPFGVPITTGGWAGNGAVIGFGLQAYALHEAFPDIVGKEPTLRALGYVLGCHPGSSRSFVSAVGAESKTVAYGSNRADFSFIAGGVVPGALILAKDFPENKEDWPFFWGQNEYVINIAASYLLAVNAAIDLLAE